MIFTFDRRSKNFNDEPIPRGPKTLFWYIVRKSEILSIIPNNNIFVWSLFALDRFFPR